jgi:predicted acyl esterase
MDEPPVKIFVMGANTWRDENEWPLTRAVETPWFLHADGGLDPGAPGADEDHDTYVYDPNDPVPTRGGAMVLAVDFPAGPSTRPGSSSAPTCSSTPASRWRTTSR